MPLVLTVDDDSGIRMLIEHQLKRGGYESIEADSGEAAIKIALERLPDIVLLDIMMPGLDGYETCRQLRAMGYKGAVILVSAMPRDIVHIGDCGADGYIQKPFKVPAMHEIWMRLTT